MLLLVLTGSFQQNGLDSANAEIKKLQTHIQQLEYNIQAMATVSQGLMLPSSTLLASSREVKLNIFRNFQIINTKEQDEIFIPFN